MTPGRADAHLAVLARRQRRRPARRRPCSSTPGSGSPTLPERGAVVRVHRGRGGHLGAAVAVAHAHARHPPLELLAHRDRQRRAAVGDVRAATTGRRPRGPGASSSCSIDGTSAPACGRSRSTSSTQPRSVEPPLQRDEARLGQVHPGHGVEQAVDVRQRQRQQQVDRARGREDLRARAARSATGPSWREHHALRAAGRPAGVEQRREVVAGPRHERTVRTRLELGEQQVGAGQQLVAGQHDAHVEPGGGLGDQRQAGRRGDRPRALRRRPATCRSSGGVTAEMTGVGTAPARHSAA